MGAPHSELLGGGVLEGGCVCGLQSDYMSWRSQRCAGSTEGAKARGEHLILSDSLAAIPTIKKAGRTGNARARDLAEVMDTYRARK